MANLQQTKFALVDLIFPIYTLAGFTITEFTHLNAKCTEEMIDAHTNWH